MIMPTQDDVDEAFGDGICQEYVIPFTLHQSYRKNEDTI